MAGVCLWGLKSKLAREPKAVAAFIAGMRDAYRYVTATQPATIAGILQHPIYSGVYCYGRRRVDDWLPLHAWTVEEVWSRIRASGVRHHPAYDLGMPRFSCCFCIFSPRSALLLAGKHNPELLARQVEVERKIEHRFRLQLPLAEIHQALRRGEEPGPVHDWVM